MTVDPAKPAPSTPTTRSGTARRCSSSSPSRSARCARHRSTPRSTSATARSICANAAASTASSRRWGLCPEHKQHACPGITDVTAVTDRLRPELTTLAARIACIADARPQAEYARILTAAGLRTVRTERHEQAMTRMIDQIEARLNLLRMTAAAELADAGVDLDAAPAVLGAARTAVAEGTLGYALIVAEKTTKTP